MSADWDGEIEPVDDSEIEAVLTASSRRVKELEAERAVVLDKLARLGESIHLLLAERKELHSALAEMRGDADDPLPMAHRLAPVYRLRGRRRPSGLFGLEAPQGVDTMPPGA